MAPVMTAQNFFVRLPAQGEGWGEKKAIEKP
jgi:hypothetical protein